MLNGKNKERDLLTKRNWKGKKKKKKEKQKNKNNTKQYNSAVHATWKKKNSLQLRQEK